MSSILSSFQAKRGTESCDRHSNEARKCCFMTVSHSAQMLLKLEKCIPISHVTLETVPKYANIERPTSSQLYASLKLGHFRKIALIFLPLTCEYQMCSQEYLNSSINTLMFKEFDSLRRPIWLFIKFLKALPQRQII